MSKVRLIRGDNLDVLPLLPDESVDSIVTDPPYGLSKEPDVAEVLTHWLAGDDYNHRGGGFMGKAWDSFVPGPSVWRECLRVLKPGGYFLCFAGSRTVDLMGISIRLAGFEIRDQMQWLYGSGFPKSMDVAKALDKMGEDGSAWEGWGTALKPAHEPIVVARKPFRGTVAANVLANGTGAMNIDASRIAAPGETIGPGSYSDPANQEGVVGSDLGISGADKEKFQAAQIASVEKANAMGRFPANVVLAHHPECQPTREVVTERVGGGAKASKTDSTTVDFVEGYTRGDGWTGGEITTEVWDCHPDCAVRLLDEQSGILTSGKPAGGSGPHKAKASVGKGGGPALEGSADGSLRKEGVEYHLYGDSGGASRFFYCSKTSKAERNAGLPEGVKNDHPTVKPVRLMEYLVRLVTPPGGTVLDPYIGSGTTGIAAANLGFDCIGIDRDDEGTYIDIAAHRVKHAGGEVQKQAFVPGVA